MILYLDASCLVKLFVDEPGSTRVKRKAGTVTAPCSSDLAYAEARSAFARRRRERSLPETAYRRAISDLDADWNRFIKIPVTDSLIRDAATLIESRALRTLDALHLASALSLHSPSMSRGTTFMTSDVRLADAARLEGLTVESPS